MWTLLFAVLPACGPREGAPSIVLVSLDTLRADRLGAWGNPDGLSPNLDRFAREAIRFENAYSQATLTAPSHASLFSSRYPSEQTGPGRQPAFGKDKPLLAEVLRVYGYQTGAFVGGGDLNPHMGLTAGFEAYVSPRDFGSLWHTVPHALEWISARDDERPFFAFIHGYDAHARYLKPPPFGYSRADAGRGGPGQQAARGATERVVDRAFHVDLGVFQRVQERLMRPRSAAGIALYAALSAQETPPPAPLDDGDVALIRGVYDGAVAYADAQFGLLMAGLSERGVLDEAVVIVISDHGEQLGEEGLFTHSLGLDDEETHVPLMIRMPDGAGAGRRVTALVGLIDVMPTAVELAGGVVPAEVHGRSLAGALRGGAFTGRDAVFTQGNDRMRSVSARGPAGRLTYTGIQATSPLLSEMIDAARLDGPGFVSTGDPAGREALRSATTAWLRTLSASPKERREELPEALRDELRAHGYWDADR